MDRYNEIYSCVEEVSDTNLPLILVDCACGQGQIIYRFQKYTNFIVKGYDLDPNQIELCLKKNLNVEVGNIKNLSCENESVDIFISSETLEHLDEEEFLLAVQEIDRILKPNGILIITVPASKEATFIKKSILHKLYISHDKIISSFPSYMVLKEYVKYKSDKRKIQNFGTRIIVLKKKSIY